MHRLSTHDAPCLGLRNDDVRAALSLVGLYFWRADLLWLRAALPDGPVLSRPARP